MTTLIVSKEFHDNIELPLFKSFPYLATRLSPAFYHIRLYSRSIEREKSIGLAEFQADLNGLLACFVLGEEECVYFDQGTKPSLSDQPPQGGKIAYEKLQPPTTEYDPEMLCDRRAELIVFAEKANRGGQYLLGDLTKGGEKASPEELERMAGYQANGLPVGLSKCKDCGDYKGRCLDPSENFAGQMMTVSCFCQNNNRCAWCIQLLNERKLNANYYKPSTDEIWHVPGFSCFSHECHGPWPTGDVQ